MVCAWGGAFREDANAIEMDGHLLPVEVPLYYSITFAYTG